MLLFVGTIALIWANSPLQELYTYLMEEFHVSISLESDAGGFGVGMHSIHWINDGLMTLFFLMAGLEIKREMLAGELANFKQAILPIFAAVGGMVVPIIIYKLFMKFILSAFSSFLLDITLFTIFVSILPEMNCGAISKIVVATVMARTLSSLYNYCINSKVVFKNSNKRSILKYYTVVATIMLVSGFCVSTLFKLTGINATILKVFVDTIIFFIDFCVQREWVFKKKQ